MNYKSWKETQSLLSLSDYRKIYASIADLSNFDKSMAIHKLLINLSDVYLNPDYENDTMLTAKNGFRYSAECDAWAIGELAKVKNLLAELNELGVKSYNNESRVSDGESYFLGFLKMECVLRYRPLLANSWRIEIR